MTKAERAIFIEEMEKFGDEWTDKQVADAYGDMSLDEAIASRQSEHKSFANIIDKVLNR